MERQTGIEGYYVIKNNKRLRMGYTTGSCAAAATAGAVRMLLTGKEVEAVELDTPKGIRLTLYMEDVKRTQDTVSCAVRKDGGDDPDVTHGLLIYATVTKTSGTEIVIDGGEGVGRATKKGLKQAIGEAAINPVPLSMIREAAGRERTKAGYTGGLSVVISVPGGEEIAQRTFNPRIGIEGGISILGTSGIVSPMSEAALIESIRLEMKTILASGQEWILITPGNYGEDFLRNELGIRNVVSMKCSNFIGETVDLAVELGAKGILFVAHIGKFIKLSGGIMNTHSHNADARADLMATAAIRAGAEYPVVKEILASNTTEEGVDILLKNDVLKPTMEVVADRVRYYLQSRCLSAIRTETLLFSSVHGFLSQTKGAKDLLEIFRNMDKQEEDKDQK